MVADVVDDPHIVVGWPLANNGAFFEFFSLAEVDSALSSVRLSLYIAGGLTLGLSVIAGHLPLVGRYDRLQMLPGRQIDRRWPTRYLVEPREGPRSWGSC